MKLRFGLDVSSILAPKTTSGWGGKQPAVVTEQGMWIRGTAVVWVLDVVEGCPGAYMVEPSTTIHPRCQ